MREFLSAIARARNTVIGDEPTSAFARPSLRLSVRHLGATIKRGMSDTKPGAMKGMKGIKGIWILLDYQSVRDSGFV